jgi:transcriptional regulator with XRE-family HTH domain
MLKPSLKGVKEKMDKINKEIKKSVGKRLKEFWQHLGKGQEEFAKIIGITNISVSNIESGNSLKSTENLHSLARNTRINLYWFLNGEPPDDRIERR